MTSWLYWLFFAIVAGLVLGGPPICSWLEERDEQRDLELWMRMPGATR